MRKLGRSVVMIVAVLTCCVDPYKIKSISNKQMLVVEGRITDELKEHQVILSRTSTIDKPQFIPEVGAEVTISINGGSVYLVESSPGVYLTPPLAGVVGNIYTLEITTSDRKRYTSTPETLRDGPDIESIYGKYIADETAGLGQGGIKIYLDTKASTIGSRYYRWEFEETWQIQTPSESEFVWLGGNEVVLRSTPVSTCYPSDTSKNVIIQSTAGLAQDKVTAQLIQTIPNNSLKMSIQYSILVTQYFLSEQAYFFWEAVKKINQTQGTLYDVQPGAVTGNISAVDGGATVIGYFDASAKKQRRVFFKPKQFLSDGYQIASFESYCNFLTPIQVPADQIGAFYAQPGFSNYDITGATGFGPATLFLVPKECCDCTSVGTNVKPSFWP